VDNLKKGRDLGVAIIFVAKIFAMGGGKRVLGFPQIHADKRRRLAQIQKRELLSSRTKNIADFGELLI